MPLSPCSTTGSSLTSDGRQFGDAHARTTALSSKVLRCRAKRTTMTTTSRMKGQASERPLAVGWYTWVNASRPPSSSAPHHGEREADQPADEAHGHRLEGEAGERLVVEKQDRRQQHGGQPGEREGQGPDHRRHQPGLHTHEPGGDAVVGDGPHPHSQPGPAQEMVQPVEDGAGGDQQHDLVVGHRVVGPGDLHGLADQRRREYLPPGVAPPRHDEHEALGEDEQGQGRHGLQVGPVGQPADDQPFERQSRGARPRRCRR